MPSKITTVVLFAGDDAEFYLFKIAPLKNKNGMQTGIIFS